MGVSEWYDISDFEEQRELYFDKSSSAVSQVFDVICFELRLKLNHHMPLPDPFLFPRKNKVVQRLSSSIHRLVPEEGYTISAVPSDESIVLDGELRSGLDCDALQNQQLEFGARVGRVVGILFLQLLLGKIVTRVVVRLSTRRIAASK